MQKLFTSTCIRWYLYLAILFAPSLAYGGLVKYNLQADPYSPQTVLVSADTSTLGEFSLTQARTIPFSKAKTALEIHCKTGSDTTKIVYGQEVECQQITWSIDFKQIPVRGTDVSEQRNLYSSAGWWLLFEWNSIPRLQGHSVEICANPANSTATDKCRQLPDLNAAPLIMVWGQARTLKAQGDNKFSIYADTQRVLSNQGWSQLMAQYSYLQQLLQPKSGHKRDIDIIWVGIDESFGSMGGATGSQSFVANYLVKNNQVSQANLSKLHWISGHEIFHLLSPFLTPLWISESLAHYYGYKSLIKAGVPVQTPVEIWQSKLATAAHASTGLYAAHEMVTDKNDMSYYGLFYNKGAAFWQQLDDELKRNGSSLDSHIALLAGTSSVKPNKNFVAAVEAVLGKKEFSQLVSKYLL